MYGSMCGYILYISLFLNACGDESSPLILQVILYEDELADNGVSLLSVKVVSLETELSVVALHSLGRLAGD